MSHTPFTVPVGGTDSKKLENIGKIQPGMVLGIVTGIYDIGTQETNFGPKNQVLLSIEFPQELRQFYEGEDMRPKMISNKYTLSFSPNSNLRRDVGQLTGTIISDQEAGTYDLTSLLGKATIVTIVHSACGKYENIASFAPLTDQAALMFGLQNKTQAEGLRVNDLIFFHKAMGFDSPNFAACPKWIRTKIMGSSEGLAHTASGGKFAEPEKKPRKKFIMLPHAQHTEKQLLDAGWTHDQIISQGLGKWEEVAQPPAPVNTPQGMTTPNTPAPTRQLVMIDTKFSKEQYLSTPGWTEEMLVQQGLAKWVMPQAQPQAPVAPQQPAMPQAPAQPQVPAMPTPSQATAVNNQQQFQAQPMQAPTTPSVGGQGMATPQAQAVAPVAPQTPVTPQAPQAPAPAGTMQAGVYPTPPSNNTGDDDLPF